MKCLTKSNNELFEKGRWDIDYHMPPEKINLFNSSILKKVSDIADIVKTKRDPTKEPEIEFLYVDISSVDVQMGVITNPQELLGKEAPSRARKVIRENDLVISTCRPTRGAIAVVSKKYDNQICSTGFSVIRPKKNTNPFYLHFALRLESTLEQFRKFSTGSSYPAILDEDVEKTIIPIPDKQTQDLIAENLIKNYQEWKKAVTKANLEYKQNVDTIITSLT